MDRDISESAILLRHPYPVNVSQAQTITTLTRGTSPAAANSRGIRLHSVTRGVSVPSGTPNAAANSPTYGLQIITDATTQFSLWDRDIGAVSIREFVNPPKIPFGADGTIKIQTDCNAVSTNDALLSILYSFY